MIITCFGHSSFDKFDTFESFILSTFNEKAKEDDLEFYIGGYGNFDEFIYRCCMKLKVNNSNVKVVFITPYIDENYQKNHLSYYKNMYDEIVYPSLEKVPHRFAISYRNRWMVEQADYIITYINHDWGGAYQAYRYAIKKGKTVLNLGSI